MDSSEGVGGKLPVEVIERVLSLLPVPALCRMRSVCKTWKELISRPSFHDLCDLNGRNNVYLFMWREHWRRVQGGRSRLRGVIEPSFTETFSFLDLDARRWYSIQSTELPRVSACGIAMETRFMAMDDGLVCELTSLRGADNHFTLTLYDPVAKTRRTLPAPPEFYGGPRPLIATVVNDATLSYKVFLLNNLCQTGAQKALPRVYVHESLSNGWRGLRTLPNGVEGPWAESAVVLHQSVYVLKPISQDSEYDQLSLLRHKIQGGSWTEVWRMSFRRGLRDPESSRLVVSDNRLFVIVWLESVDWRVEPLPSEYDCPNSESLFRTNQDDPDTLIEMYEILIAENSRKPVVQLTDGQLQQIFGNHDPYLDVTYIYPCFDSNGRCISVVLVSKYTGELRRYDMATGAVDVLPPHPQSEEPAPVLSNNDLVLHYTKTMKLSLRNLLALH